MSISDRLNEDLKRAMRSRDSARKGVIRFLLSDIHNQEIARQTGLDDEAILELLGRQAQQRRDSIDAFRQGGRRDLVEKEETELGIILEYLPEQMTPDEINMVAHEVIFEVGASGPQDIGKVMGKIMPQVKGRVSGKDVSAAVKQILEEIGGSAA